MRWALASRRIVTPDGVVDGAVLVEGERIAGVVRRGELAAGGEIEDVGALAVLPGGVDPHVHLNDPGRDWEGFASGTRAAAAGGLTTLGDMPLNSHPVTIDLAALVAKETTSRGRLHVDVGFHGGVIPGNTGSLDALVDAGVLAFKAFLAPSGIDEFPAVGEGDLRQAMTVLARRGRTLLAHAELPHELAAVPGDPSRYATWLASRPSRFETAAIELLLRLVRETGCAVHIVHLATADALPMLRQARREGLPVTVETCPHYLTFAAEELADGDPRFKCAPPIREASHREALWEALAEGTIDLVDSDHSPAPSAMKTADLMTSWGGIASLQVALAATWTGARARGFGLDDLARWHAAAPARLLGLGGRKGAIVPDADADLVVFDPDATFVVRGDDLEHRHPQTAYEGRTLHGIVHRTILRGRRVYDRAEGFASASGSIVRRGDRT